MDRSVVRTALVIGTALVWLVAIATVRAGPDAGAGALTRATVVDDILAERATDMNAVERALTAHAVRVAAAEHGVDPLLLLAVMEQESGFAVAARGPRGSVGLMQIQPAVGTELAARLGLDTADPEWLDRVEANVEVAASLLAGLSDRFADPRLALRAYNRGPARVDRERALGSLPSRYAYADAVLAIYDEHVERVRGLTLHGPALLEPRQTR